MIIKVVNEESNVYIIVSLLLLLLLLLTSRLRPPNRGNWGLPLRNKIIEIQTRTTDMCVLHPHNYLNNDNNTICNNDDDDDDDDEDTKKKKTLTTQQHTINIIRNIHLAPLLRYHTTNQ